MWNTEYKIYTSLQKINLSLLSGSHQRYDEFLRSHLGRSVPDFSIEFGLRSPREKNSGIRRQNKGRSNYIKYLRKVFDGRTLYVVQRLDRVFDSGTFYYGYYEGKKVGEKRCLSG